MSSPPVATLLHGVRGLDTSSTHPLGRESWRYWVLRLLRNAADGSEPVRLRISHARRPRACGPAPSTTLDTHSEGGLTPARRRGSNGAGQCYTIGSSREPRDRLAQHSDASVHEPGACLLPRRRASGPAPPIQGERGCPAHHRREFGSASARSARARQRLRNAATDNGLSQHFAYHCLSHKRASPLPQEGPRTDSPNTPGGARAS